ncbi:MAG: hypothetical protein ACPF83_07450 [Flavobacteriales bacterium]
MSQKQQSNSTEEQTQQKADQQKATQAAPAQRAAYADTSRPEDDELSQLKLKADQSNLVSNLQALQRKADRSAQVQQLKVFQMMYPNKMESSFSGEVQEANSAAVKGEDGNGPGPYVGGTQGFNAFISSGQMFKWIYSEKNGVVIICPTLKHAVAAGGAEVITAGHGQLTGEGAIWINNDTGHYQTSPESLKLSLDEWRKLGYNPTIKERVDFAASLAGLGGGGGRKKRFGKF